MNEIKQKLRRLSKYSNKTSYYKTLANNFNYQNVRGYSDTKNISKWMALQIYLLENQLYETKGHFAKQVAISASIDCLCSKVPVYWLQKELIELLMITKNPSRSIEFLPFAEKGILMIPDNTIISPGKQWLKWIYFEYIEAGKEIPNRKIVNGEFQINIKMETREENDAIRWMTILEDGAIYAKTVDPKNILEELNFNYDPHDYPYKEQFQYDKEKEFIDSVTKIVYQTMLYCYMHKIKTKKSDRSIKKGFGKESNKIHKLAPVWIGKETTRSLSNDSNSVIQIKRQYRVEMSYRSGHWRNQKIGSKSEQNSKLIWIKPTVINYKNTV